RAQRDGKRGGPVAVVCRAEQIRRAVLAEADDLRGRRGGDRHSEEKRHTETHAEESRESHGVTYLSIGLTYTHVVAGQAPILHARRRGQRRIPAECRGSPAREITTTSHASPTH